MISVLRPLRDKMSSLLGKASVRSVATLVGGTAFAQFLMALALPILSRLYTPADFSVLAVYVSVLALISVAACLRFDVAIPLPEEDADAANLLALALSFSALTAIGLAALVLIYPNFIIDLVGEPRLAPHLWLLPVGVWLTSSYAALQFWATRRKTFGVIARTRVTQAIGGAGAQVTLGYFGFAPFGLLIGYALNSGAGLFGLARTALRNDSKVLKGVSLSRMRCQFKEFSRFPKYSTFEAVGNIAAIQVPVILIAAYAVGPEAGFLMLAMRAMQAPMAMLGAAVSQVYLSRAPAEFRSNNLGSFTLRVMTKLGRTGVGPLILAGIVAPVIFPLIFGKGWLRAGELMSWMTPWFVVQFISTPIAASLHVTGHQRTALALQVIGLAIRVGAVAIAVAVSVEHVAEVFAVSSFLFHILGLVVICRYAGVRRMQAMRALLPSVPIIAAWACIGIVMALIGQRVNVLI